MATLRAVYQMDADNVKFKLQGFSGSALANTTTAIDWKFPESRYFTGGQLLVNGGNWGDTIKIQIIDLDNIYGFGVGAVLGEHVTDYAVNPSVCLQSEIVCPYVAFITANLYIRILYTNISSNSVSIAMNLHTHIPR